MNRDSGRSIANSSPGRFSRNPSGQHDRFQSGGKVYCTGRLRHIATHVRPEKEARDFSVSIIVTQDLGRRFRSENRIHTNSI